MGNLTICIGKNKGADQLRGNREADQRLCFRYTDSTIPLLSKFKISKIDTKSFVSWFNTFLLQYNGRFSTQFYSFLLWYFLPLYNFICAEINGSLT